MIWLGVETSTNLGSVAVFDGAKLLRETEWSREGSHSEHLTKSCEAMFHELDIEWNDIARIAVGVGPGSFTGIRVAVNFARTAAFVQKIKLYALDSLTLTAMGLMDDQVTHSGKSIVVANYAFRDLVYCAEFAPAKSSLSVLEAPRILTKVQWLERISPEKVIAGTALEVFSGDIPTNVQNMTGPKNYPHASAFARASVHEIAERQLLLWNQAVPLYIRASEAEEKLRSGLLKPS